MPRLLAMLFVLLGLFCAAALPAHAEDYDTVLDRLSRLQALAREYSANQTDTPDPIELTLAYTRTGEYNTTIWQLTAGVRDAGFESYVNSSDPELASLQNMNTVVLPNGESIDFGHLLASMNLVYNGIPITGSWGGDCEELARQYYGQAGDAAQVHDARHAEVQVAGFLGHGLAQRTVHDNCAKRDGAHDPRNQTAVHITCPPCVRRGG